METEPLTKCLTDNCNECTGAYISEVLGKRFICNYTCHGRNSVKQS